MFSLEHWKILFKVLTAVLAICRIPLIVSVPRQKSGKSKIEDLKKLNNKLSEFIETASRKDSAAEEEIKKSKEDFYTKYSYLKPES